MDSFLNSLSSPLSNPTVFNVIATTAVSGLLGVLAGYLIHIVITLRLQGRAKEEARSIITRAREEADALLARSRMREDEQSFKWQAADERLERKEQILTAREDKLEIEREGFKAAEARAKEAERSFIAGLEDIAGFTQAEARESLMSHAQKQAENDLRARTFKLERDNAEHLEARAKKILTSIIQRLAMTNTSTLLTSHIPITSDDVKGKVIGKEGRNIKAFESASGVEILVDESPNALVISSFDPLRRAIARMALEELIADGRIHPARIEEVVAKTKEKTGQIIKEKGEWACSECDIYDLDPKLVSILGRLYFRTSYGQNVLEHSVEMAHIAGMLASELGGDIYVARAGALLHDIGKALDHEIEGTHVEIGRRLLKKFNVDERIIKAMQAHHEEYPYETLESIIVQTADSLSGGRPGARRESTELYLKRLGDLERIAQAHKGVEKTYALSAGRELRVFISAEEIDDLHAHKLAREIAGEIEKELRFPGEIKVCVIRETRCITFAR